LENSEITIPVVDGWNAFGFVYEGDVFSGKQLSKGELGIYGKEGESIIKQVTIKQVYFWRQENR